MAAQQCETQSCAPPTPSSNAVGTLLGAVAVPDAPSGNAAAPGLDQDASEMLLRDEEPIIQPALSKGMPFYNGFLYKLGDGLLNTSWNLRYVLLIGSSLQYFRSPHEAKPRDVISLSGATVQWTKDQSRPFVFTVSKEGQRSFCMSGNTERETCEWVERIQAASKLTPEVVAPVGNAVSKRCEGLLPLGAELAPAVDGALDATHEASIQTCAQAVLQAAFGEGFRLRELRSGLRITQREDRDSGCDLPVAELLCLLFVAMALLAAFVVFLQRVGPGFSEVQERLAQCERALRAALPFAALAAAAVRLLEPSWRSPAPVVCASVRVECSTQSEELREALADPALHGEWRPDHLEGRALTVAPIQDEVLHSRFRLGGLGLKARVAVRQRWIRSAGGVRLLCIVADDQCGGGEVTGFEGFALLPCEEGGGCTVVWLCALDLAPWAPRSLRALMAVQRISALVGLREWLGSPTARHSRSEQRLAAREVSAPQSPEASPQSTALLRGSQRAAAGGLLCPLDLERASLATELLCSLCGQLLIGGRKVALTAAPHGLQIQSGTDVVHRYAARWAYASSLLQAAAVTERPRDRLALVAAFLVAGLHLAAISFPHLPWVAWPCGESRQSTVLPDDIRVSVEVTGGTTGDQNPKLPSATAARRASFEVLSAKAGASFRICGTDEPICQLEFPGTFSFRDGGSTVVEFGGGGSVRLSMPELRVRPSGWSLGMGAIYEWRGSAHLVDVQAGLQCDLCFGPSDEAEGGDAVVGAIRDALGFEVGRIKGTWLGALVCDGEVLWRGPRLQPAPL